MNILITGSNGQLGKEIRDLITSNNKIDFFLKDLTDLDICDYKSLEKFIIDNNINGVINCAAYTDVESAEENVESAVKINSDGVSNLVNALKCVDGKLIHISTDYVFDGSNSSPYKESDKVNPIGVYGRTKRDGELHVINSGIDAIVIRTSWLYSSFGNNFVKKIFSRGLINKELKVVVDQKGSPTYAKDLARLCLDIFYTNFFAGISKKGRLYHYSNDGEISWFDFATEIIKLSKINCKVLPVLSKDYISKVNRPNYSVLDTSKIKKDFNIEIPHWKDGLKDCILKLKKTP